ncbi:peptidoglycan-binding protein [Streptomyces sp. NPDC051940]|uniref:peptidoglycan-binding domain-containing protein n=1 Tax=Streptomyces sp. NPDC051940 TaxID=3155675 RepID=UPI00341753C8
MDDWDNEGVVDRDTNRSSNATCLWQKVLWADGFLPASGVDGVFGDNTYKATKAWQVYRNKAYEVGLAEDGSAGRATWGEAGYGAEGMGIYLTGSDAPGATMTGNYIGRYAMFNMKRDADGNYQFIDGDGAWRKAGYDYRTCG